MKHQILNLPETAREWSRAVAPVLAHHTSASRGRFRRAVEQQELGHSFVDKELEQNFGEEASPAARRDESGPMTLFGTATASRRGPTGGLGAAAPVRAASGARAPAYNLPTWQLRRRFHTHTHTHTHTHSHSESASKTPGLHFFLFADAPSRSLCQTPAGASQRPTLARLVRGRGSSGGARVTPERG